MTRPARNPVKLFVSYSHKDEKHLDKLRTQLSGLRQQGLVEEWHDRKIGAGQEWDKIIDENLKASEIVLLLVSPDFMASEYINEKEIKWALEKHECGEARVIPVIVRPSYWEWASFAKLQALPKDARPITRWPDRDEAWLDVTLGIKKAVEGLISERNMRRIGEERREAVPLHLRAIVRACLNLLYGIDEANRSVLLRIGAQSDTILQHLANDNYNSVCKRCEDVRQQRIESDLYLDTLCNDPDIYLVCKRKWYLGERLQEYRAVIEGYPNFSQEHLLVQQHLKQHVSDPPLNPLGLQQAVSAAIPMLENVLIQN